MQNTYSLIAENIIERGVASALQEQLSTTNSRANLLDRTVQVIRQNTENLPILIELQADCIRFVLDRSEQNRTRAATFPGIDRVSLWRRFYVVQRDVIYLCFVRSGDAQKRPGGNISKR